MPLCVCVCVCVYLWPSSCSYAHLCFCVFVQEVRELRVTAVVFLVSPLWHCVFERVRLCTWKRVVACSPLFLFLSPYLASHDVIFSLVECVCVCVFQSENSCWRVVGEPWQNSSRGKWRILYILDISCLSLCSSSLFLYRSFSLSYTSHKYICVYFIWPSEMH